MPRRGRRQDRRAIIGAPAGSVSMHENVTTAHAGRAVVPARRRPRATASSARAMDFPSMIYLYRAQQARGLRADGRAGGGGSDGATDRVLEAIDERRRSWPSRTCCSGPRSSWMRRPIVARAHEVGATVILDAYQSAGIIPVDVDGARRRLRRRRLPEMAVRRARQRVSLHAAGPAADASQPRSPDGCRTARRSRSTSTRSSRARRCDADDERHAVDSGVLRGAGRARHHPRGRRAAHSREVIAG